MNAKEWNEKYDVGTWVFVEAPDQEKKTFTLSEAYDVEGNTVIMLSDIPNVVNVELVHPVDLQPTLPPLENKIFHTFIDWKDEPLTNCDIYDFMHSLTEHGLQISRIPESEKTTQEISESEV